MAIKEYLRHGFVSAVVWLLIIQAMFPCLHSEDHKRSCSESERTALLDFKEGLTDPQNILSSWEGEECCTWWGVACNKKTGHVVELNLRSDNGRNLGGKINPSLVYLKHLRRLDLSQNDFTGSHIPEFFGSLENLRYLNLSRAGFTGKVPPQLGNLSRLLYLDLSYNENNLLNLHTNDLQWLKHLSSLKHLDMSFVNLTTAVDWLSMLNMLPSLTVLKLNLCGLDSIPNYLPNINFTALNTLELLGNNFNDTLPMWLWNISSLTNLDLSDSGFYGPIPDSIGTLISLEVLYLSDNNFDGIMPSSIRNLCRLNTLDLSGNKISGEINEFVEGLPNCTKQRLQTLRLSSNRFNGKLTSGLKQMVNISILDLSNNQLDGALPEVIGKLLQLTYLDLSSNSFKDVVNEAHFVNLTRLKTLVLSQNPLTISLNESWVPSFQLNVVGLQSCSLGPQFPAWLKHQKELSELDLSSSGISGMVPEWFWRNFPPTITYLDLSNNQISGKLPTSLEFAQDSWISLSSNLFEGPLPPRLPYNTNWLSLSNNTFSGPLPSIKSQYLLLLDLSNNLFNSSIPSSWSTVGGLEFLDLSDNNFTGEIPNKWPAEFIESINLGNNHLSGRIPSSICSITTLQSLDMRNNSFSGTFPESLRTCTGLNYLDLSQNKFYGNIPTWLGESFQYLSILLLRSNMFSGNIPPQLVQLRYLRILDLAENSLSGLIPHQLSNLSEMASVTKQHSGDYFSLIYGNILTFIADYYISSTVFTKGEELKYTKNGYLVRSIDLSNNHLRGDIPEEIETLIGLTNLNLSANCLEGKIPEKIGRLQTLESLDLSRNELSGNIPLSISSLHYLSYLNLSHNRLSGRIPSGNQLQTLIDPSIYAGNIDLCGPPLPNNCSNSTISEGGNGGYDDEDGDEMVWLYLGMALGYVVGFWAVCGVLWFKKTWRYAYFRFFDSIYDQLYVVASLTLAKLKRAMMKRN